MNDLVQDLSSRDSSCYKKEPNDYDSLMNGPPEKTKEETSLSQQDAPSADHANDMMAQMD